MTDIHNEKSLVKNLKLWIGILFVLLVIVNTVFFVIYQNANSSMDLPNQLWNYFESNTFQGITASLVAPIIFFFLENRLRFIESLQQNRQKQNELEEEKIKEKKEELKEKQRRMHELVQSHLSQFEEIVSSLWYRHYNLLFMDGKIVMETRDDDYYMHSHLYALACLLAYKRIFLLDGIYPKIGLYCEGLDIIIKDRLNKISVSLDNIGKIHDVEFFRYDQLALAESAIEKENSHYRISSSLEFRRKYSDSASLDTKLLKPSIRFLELLLKLDNSIKKTELLLMTKLLSDILKGLRDKAGIKISVEGKNLEFVEQKVVSLDPDHK